jgi:hypothetical protein
MTVSGCRGPRHGPKVRAMNRAVRCQVSPTEGGVRDLAPRALGREPSSVTSVLVCCKHGQRRTSPSASRT